MASRTPFSLDLTRSLGAANCYEKLGGGNRTPIRYLEELGLLDESQARALPVGSTQPTFLGLLLRILHLALMTAQTSVLIILVLQLEFYTL
jgi:hypothetical protein